MSASENATEEDTTVHTRRLDLLERRLFARGLEGQREFRQWALGTARKLVASAAAQQRKRKRSHTGGAADE